MKPRALILDIFGDYLRYVGCEARASDLVTLLGVLGVEAATVRMTLSRLKAEGWFSTSRSGRETVYRLSDDILAVLSAGRERIFAPYQQEWDGWWTQVVFQLPDGDRNAREQMKKKLSWLGFAPLSSSTWITPRNIPAEARALADEFPGAAIDVLRSRTDDADVDRELVRRCWDVDRLNEDYAEFIAGRAEIGDHVAVLTGSAALAARTEVISTYRHFPFRDPSLPDDLRPDGWLGAQAHDLFLTIHEQLAPAATDYVSSVVGAPILVPAQAPKNM